MPPSYASIIPACFAKCGCKKFCMDFHGHHTSTCTSHSGATKAHDWMVSVLGPLFRTAGHVVRTQHGVTASAGQRRVDVEIRSYLRDQAGSRSWVFDLSIAHDRFGSSSHPQQNASLTQPQALLRIAAQRCGMRTIQRLYTYDTHVSSSSYDTLTSIYAVCALKITAYRQQYADNQNISFLPAIVSTSTRMHGEFLRLIFLQAHLRDRGALQCRWNVIAKLSNGRVPFQARGFPPVTEEQDRPSSLQSGGVEDQPQYPGLWHRGSPSARSFSRSPSPPPPPFTPAFTSA